MASLGGTGLLAKAHRELSGHEDDDAVVPCGLAVSRRGLVLNCLELQRLPCRARATELSGGRGPGAAGASAPHRQLRHDSLHPHELLVLKRQHRLVLVQALQRSSLLDGRIERLVVVRHERLANLCRACDRGLVARHGAARWAVGGAWAGYHQRTGRSPPSEPPLPPTARAVPRPGISGQRGM